jgi:hypothetical protein
MNDAIENRTEAMREILIERAVILATSTPISRRRTFVVCQVAETAVRDKPGIKKSDISE